MEYISKKDLLDVIEKMAESRKKNANCSRQSAVEYQTFKYILAVIGKMETHEAD